MFYQIQQEFHPPLFHRKLRKEIKRLKSDAAYLQWKKNMIDEVEEYKYNKLGKVINWLAETIDEEPQNFEYATYPNKT